MDVLRLVAELMCSKLVPCFKNINAETFLDVAAAIFTDLTCAPYFYSAAVFAFHVLPALLLWTVLRPHPSLSPVLLSHILRL